MLRRKKKLQETKAVEEPLNQDFPEPALKTRCVKLIFTSAYVPGFQSINTGTWSEEDIATIVKNIGKDYVVGSSINGTINLKFFATVEVKRIVD